ncbi:MAG: protein kinase [Anaerolineales bacterium]
MNNLSGSIFKGYELEEQIGAGAFGAVYRATQSTMRRQVAVKIILPGRANNPKFIRSFEVEAQLIARLEHLHIVPLYDFWRDPSGAYLVMRWMRGGSLRDAVANGPLDLETTAVNLDQLAAGLTSAHSQNIVHRDIKPSNLLLDQEGNAYLADFGIAMDFRGINGSSADQYEMASSSAYMAPEQALGEAITPQTDIYSLGITLYEVLSGQHPYSGMDTDSLVYQLIHDPLPWIDTLNPEIKSEVNQVIQKATHKNPKRRYQSALELANAFREAAGLNYEVRDTPLEETLTRREHEILHLIVEGYSNKQIAQTLFIELTTVKWHITQLYRKLRVRSRVQAIVRARELDLIGFARDERQAGTDKITVSLPEPTNPYKGLRAFTSADERDFFGREALVEDLLSQLEADGPLTRFLAVVGPSGSGKSSLVDAGLLPGLRSGKLPGSERWFIVRMTPGSRPLEALEVALTRVAVEQGSSIQELLQRDENGLMSVADLILPQDGSDLLLVIDQFEELFTLVEDDSVRSHFLDLLYSAVTGSHSRVRVIVTLRADLYGRALIHPAFGELIRNRMETVLPLSADELEGAIRKPAEQVGVSFEPGLIATIREDMLSQPAALPLLQYALTELFEGRKGRLLTIQAYESNGRAVGTLAQRAEEIYQELDDPGREAMRQMFLRLVTLGGSLENTGRSPDTRRRVPRAELLGIAGDAEQMDEIIETLAAYRLLSLDHDQSSRQPTVEIAHEAILESWERLGAWLDESREDLHQHRRLTTLSDEWRQADRDPGYLLKDTRLDQFVRWAAGANLALTANEQAFLDASIIADEKFRAEEQRRQLRALETAQKLAETEAHRAVEQREAGRRFRRLALGLAFILVIAVAAAILAFQQAQRAEQQARLERARELAAAAQSNLDVDPELSILLALAAINATYPEDQIIVPEVESVLHQAVSTSHVLLTLYSDDTHKGNWASNAAFSPDGSRLVTTYCTEAAAYLWDAVSGEKLAKFIHGGGYPGVFAVAFSPDGTRIATGGGGDSSLAKIWDVSTGEMLLSLSGHSEPINKLAFSEDGKRIATASADRTVKVWDAYTGREQLSLEGHSGFANDVVFSPDGKLLATVDDRFAHIWDAISGEKLLSLSGHTSRVWGVDISSDGELLATASADGTAKVWDLKTGQLLQSLNAHTAGVRDVAFSFDGTRLATASVDGTARVWELRTGGLLLNLTGHTDQVLTVEFSADGRRLVTTSTDQTAKVWSLFPDQESFAFSTGTAYDVAFNADGTRLATTSARGTATIWDPATGRHIRTFSDAHFTQPQNAIEYSILGTRIAPGVAFSPDGKQLAVAGSDRNVIVWDMDTGQEVLTLKGHSGDVNHIAYSPDGMLIATASEDSTARIWDTVSGEVLWTISDHTEFVQHVVFSPDGTRLVTTSSIGEVFVWDVDARERVATLSGHSDNVTYASFSPDGANLATASGDGRVKVWKVGTWKEIMNLSGHTNIINSVVYSQDGKSLVTASADGSARIWDAASGQELLAIPSHAGGVGYAVLNPDGTRLITSDWDNTLRFYVLPIDELIELARERVTRSLTAEECLRFLHTEDCPPISMESK